MPNTCADCNDLGWVRNGVDDIVDPRFGKLVRCPKGCKSQESRLKVPLMPMPEHYEELFDYPAVWPWIPGERPIARPPAPPQTDLAPLKARLDNLETRFRRPQPRPEPPPSTSTPPHQRGGFTMEAQEDAEHTETQE